MTQANKGIGFEICRQLASQGITVVLNARDERRGLDSFHKLKGTDALSSDLLFHQLDVAEPSSVASIAEFFKARFGRLDILVSSEIPFLYSIISSFSTEFLCNYVE